MIWRSWKWFGEVENDLRGLKIDFNISKKNELKIHANMIRIREYTSSANRILIMPRTDADHRLQNPLIQYSVHIQAGCSDSPMSGHSPVSCYHQ